VFGDVASTDEVVALLSSTAREQAA
jgi:hypothetical protein